MDKPLGRKTYGSIAHLPGSHAHTPGDHYISEGQARIATVQTRDKHDIVVVQEKLDGSCMGVALKDGVLIPMGRAGYPAISSCYPQHKLFHNWVRHREDQFRAVLQEGERLVGEWLAQAHGTRYDLSKHSPFVAFDLMVGTKRLPYGRFADRIRKGGFASPAVISFGTGAYSVAKAMEILGDKGFHGAIDKAEGCIWRVERDDKVDFLCKFVRADYEAGKYLLQREPIWNEGWLNQDIILEHAENPRRLDPSFEPTAVGEWVHAACNDVIEIKLLVRGGVIQDIGFTGHGCVLCMGTASLLCEYMMKMSVPMALAFQPEIAWDHFAKTLEPARRRCLYVSYFALRKALGA